MARRYTGNSGGAGASLESPAFTGTPTAPRFVGAVVIVPYASSISLDATLGTTFRVTATGDLTVTNITGGADGQTIALEVLASGGDRALLIAGSTETVPSGSKWAETLRYDLGRDEWLLESGGGGGGAVSSVNGRTGAVSGLAEASDVTTALAGKAASSHTHTVSGISASGTPSNTTFLRGDGSWSTPAGGGSSAVDSVNGATGVVVLTADDLADGSSKVQMTTTERTKLSGVATGATANSADATLLARANHTGTQAAGTITGLSTVATSGSASDLGSGTVPTARLGSSTASSNTFLRGDQTWVDPQLQVAPIHAVGNSGSSLTVDASSSSGWVKTITLTANCTFTLSGATSGRVTTLELYLTQDGTGTRTVTWPAAVKWDGGIAPTLSTAAGAIDCVVLRTVNGGTTWLGNMAGKGYA